MQSETTGGEELREAEERSLRAVARLMLAEAARLDELAGVGAQSRVASAWEAGAAHFLRCAGGAAARPSD